MALLTLSFRAPTGPVSPHARRWGTFGLLLGTFLGAMETTVIAPAMPVIVQNLGGQALYILPFAVYLLASTVATPLWGRLADTYGCQRLYLSGVAIFLAASLACSLAQDMAWLIAARFVQGLGAGVIAPLTSTLIGKLYSQKERPKVQGVVSAIWGIASLAGPPLGGWLVDYASWRIVFIICLPFGVVGWLLAAIYLRDETEGRRFEIDWLGGALFIGGCSLAVWGLELRHAWQIIWGASIVALALLIEVRHPAPLLPLASLRNKTARSCIAGNFFGGAAYWGSLGYIPLLVQGVARRSAMETGIVLIPMLMGFTIASFVSSRIVQRVTPGRLAPVGLSVMALAFFGLALAVNAPIRVQAAVGLFTGLGMGTSMLALLLTTQHAVPRRELGSAMSAVVFSRTMGGTIDSATASLFLSPAMIAGGGAALGIGVRNALLLSGASAALGWFFTRNLGREEEAISRASAKDNAPSPDPEILAVPE